MESYGAKNEVDYVRVRNANRRSVIFFHGLLNGERSLETAEARDVLSENTGGVKRRSNLQDDDFSKKEKRGETEEDTICNSRDLQCLNESEEECLRKRHRTSFTSFQLKRLKEEFDQDCYIVGMKRWRLSEELEIPEKQIKIWFQNKRTKVKKHC